MIAVSRYLCQIRDDIVYKCVKRGFVFITNKRYETFQDLGAISRKMSKVLNTYSNLENTTESCYMDNGIRLVCERRKSFNTTLGCFLPAGSMYEMPEERGSVLFLEHLLFRRTKTHDQLETIVQDIGGKIAAVGMRDMFVFYGTVQSCKVDELVQLFADVILNGVICATDITEEKCVILNELAEMEVDREKVVMDYLPTIAYQGTALGNSVYTDTDTIKQFSIEKLSGFRSRLFKPCYITMISTGSVCLNELRKMVCEHFDCKVDDYKSSFGISSRMRTGTESLEYRFSAAELRLRDDDNQLAYVAIGVEGPSYKQRKEHVAFTVAKQIVGSWDMSYSGVNHNAPYIAHFAYNTDTCLMYKSFFHNYAQSTSIWGCYFVCERLKIEQMVAGLRKVWMKLCTTITEKEVSRAVNQCIAIDLMACNNSTNRFFDIVENVFRYGCYESIEQRVTEYEKINADKIREVCGKYVYDQHPVVIALGRIENLPDYALIRNGLYLLRY